MPENYFVYGEEEYMVQAKVRELKAKFGDPEAWNLERLESWADLQDRLLTQSMFAESRLFICRYQVFERDKPDLGQAEQILSGHANVLIIYANSKPDKRTNIFKLITRVSTVCEVQAPKGHELQRWLQKRAVELGGELEREAAVELIYLAGTDMLSLENELIKLINYDKKITPVNVRVLATRSMNVSIFDLVDSVVQGRGNRAMNMVEELYRWGAAEPYLLHMLARQYRLLFRLLFYKKRGYGSAEIQKIMPMHPYAFQKLHAQAGSITIRECARSLQHVAEADYLFKTGQSQGLPLLQALVAKLAKK